MYGAVVLHCMLSSCSNTVIVLLHVLTSGPTVSSAVECIAGLAVE